jgi:hypothetical protein
MYIWPSEPSLFPGRIVLIYIALLHSIWPLQGGHGFSAGKRREAPAGVDATIASRIVGSGSYGGTYSSSEVDEADREAVLRGT